MNLKKMILSLFVVLASAPALAAETVTCRIGDAEEQQATGVFRHGYAYLTIQGAVTGTEIASDVQVAIKKLNHGKFSVAARVINGVSRLQVDVVNTLPMSFRVTDRPEAAPTSYQLSFTLDCDALVQTP
jgi:hypothetical protein